MVVVLPFFLPFACGRCAVDERARDVRRVLEIVLTLRLVLHAFLKVISEYEKRYRAEHAMHWEAFFMMGTRILPFEIAQTPFLVRSKMSTTNMSDT